MSGEWVRCRLAITSVVDEVFGVAEAVRDDALDRHRAASQQQRPLALADVTAVGAQVRTWLQRPGQLVTGLGLILDRDVLVDAPLHVEWWHVDDARSEPRLLHVDLNPASTGFYDYESTEWFDAPRRTGTRNVEGPYVDVHGTGTYLFTFTVPVVADGVFLGVAGADVPASWLEDRLLDQLPADVDALVLNAAGRVVLSSAPHCLVGELVPQSALEGADQQDLPHLPWRAVLLPAR